MIPAEVRRLLHLEPGDKVRFVIEDERVEVKAAEFTVASAFGSVKPRSGVPIGLDIDEQIAIAKDDRVRKMVENHHRYLEDQAKESS